VGGGTKGNGLGTKPNVTRIYGSKTKIGGRRESQLWRRTKCKDLWSHSGMWAQTHALLPENRRREFQGDKRVVHKSKYEKGRRSIRIKRNGRNINKT